MLSIFPFTVKGYGQRQVPYSLSLALYALCASRRNHVFWTCPTCPISHQTDARGNQIPFAVATVVQEILGEPLLLAQSLVLIARFGV